MQKQKEMATAVCSAVAPKHTENLKAVDIATDVIIKQNGNTKKENTQDYLGSGNIFSKEIIETYFVLSGDTARIYSVVVIPILNLYFCSCDGFNYRKKCKHIYAVQNAVDKRGLIFVKTKTKKGTKTMVIGTVYPAKDKTFHFIGRIEGRLVILVPIYRTKYETSVKKYQVIDVEDSTEAEKYLAELEEAIERTTK